MELGERGEQEYDVSAAIKIIGKTNRAMGNTSHLFNSLTQRAFRGEL